MGLAELIRRVWSASEVQEEAIERTDARKASVERRRDRVAPGRDADLVLPTANPLDNVTACVQSPGVVLHGRWLDGAALDRQLNEVAAKFNPSR